MQEKLQFIREKCIEANPSIKDLVFGCRLLDETHQFFGKSDPITCLIADEWANEDDESHWIDHYREHSMRYTNAEIRKRFKILGREIRLADVMLAINKKNEEEGQDIADKTFEDLMWKWEWTKDNLELQSEECIEFIYNLLN